MIDHDHTVAQTCKVPSWSRNQDGENLDGAHLVVVIDQGLEGENDSQVLLLVPHHHSMAEQCKR